LILSHSSIFARAIRLYEKFGFRRNGEGPHDLFGTPLVTMEKTVEDSQEWLILLLKAAKRIQDRRASINSAPDEPFQR
jgi:hypothetical protein